MMVEIIGDKGKRKRRYDPDLARRVNEAVRKGELEDKAITISPKDIYAGFQLFMAGYKLKEIEEIIEDITSKLNPTKEQIEEFSRKLADYPKSHLSDFETYTAKYFTALMHASEDDDFELDFRELNNKGRIIDGLGYKLEDKKVEIYGDVGANVGYGAKNSEIIIHGYAGYFVGRKMESSRLVVKGSVWNVGYEARNCIITVGGDVREDVGCRAENCKIYIGGNIESLSDDIGEGTKIFCDNNGIYILVYPEK